MTARPGEFIVPATSINSTEPLLLNTARCRSCKAAVIWTVTEAGKNMPLSAATVEVRDGTLYALSHFSDCPNAKEHRKR